MAKNTFKYKILDSKLTTTISISMVLFLLGLIVLIVYSTKGISRQIKEDITVNVELSDIASGEAISFLRDSLSRSKYVKSITYISKEEALRQLADEMGEDPMDFAKFNPLPASLVINLKSDYADNDSLFYISKALSNVRYVQNVDYQRSLISEVNAKLAKITAIFTLVAVVLLMISFVLIRNTIMLLIYSNRFVINAMKLVGATKHFIRKPYIGQSAVIGIIAAMFSSVYMLLFFYFMRDDLDLFIDLKDRNMYMVVFGTMFVAGVIITCISTFFAMNKYLRHDTNELYYM